MKKNWIAFLVVSIVVFVGCKEKTDPVYPSPTATYVVTPSTIIEYGESVTISVT